jgi:predicted nucleotidyltransferase component of viral defense system
MNNKEQTRMQRRDRAWHKEVINKALEGILQELHQASVLDRFYLAGGTGLALHLGHRRSQDLDFFNPEKFNEESLLQELQQLREFRLVAKASGTLHAHMQGTKVSFFSYNYPVLYPLEAFLSVKVADPRDIAGMKISAIASRGTKRVFVDLYAVSREYALDQLLEWFKEKFAQANYSTIHVLKSLSYFEEAEKDPMPDMLVPLAWEDVKQFFTRESLRLLEQV